MAGYYGRKEERGEIQTTFTGHILRLVTSLVDANPDAKHNTGRIYGELYVWETLARMADKKREELWDRMLVEGLVSKLPEEAGKYELGMSPHFVATVSITNPVRRFNDGAMSKLLQESKWKIPAPAAKEMIEKAKIPTKPQVTKKIAERQSL